MSGAQGVKNIYAEQLTPEVLENRKKRQEEFEAKKRKVVEHNPGRRPDWSPERLQQIDEFCLKEGKRCIMWDDEASGFFLMMRWDWSKNCPAEMPNTLEAAVEQGWWAVHKQMFKAPLLDPSVPDDKLAAWVHANTMHVHQFLDNQGHVREGAAFEAL